MDPALTGRLKRLYTVLKEIEELEEVRDELQQDIQRLIVRNRLEGESFRLGKQYVISYKQQTNYQSLSQDYLKNCFQQFFRDPRDAEDLLQYIKDNRSKSKHYRLMTVNKNRKRKR